MTSYHPDPIRSAARRARLVLALELGIGAGALAVAVVATTLWVRGKPQGPSGGPEDGGVPVATTFSILRMWGQVAFLQGGQVLLGDLDLRVSFRVVLGENARLAIRLARNLDMGFSRQAAVEFRPAADSRFVTLYLESGTTRVSIDAGKPGEPEGVRIQTRVGDVEASYASFEATVVPEGLYLAVNTGIVRVTVARTGRQVLVVAGQSVFLGPDDEPYRFSDDLALGAREGVASSSGQGDYVLAAPGAVIESVEEARKKVEAEASRIVRSADPLKLVHDLLLQTREDLENLDIDPCLRRARWPFDLKDERLTQETVLKAYVILTHRFRKVEIELPGERHWPAEKLEIVRLSEDRIIARYPCRVALTGRVGREEGRVKWKDIDVTLVFEKTGDRWLAVSMDFPDKVPIWVSKPEEYKKLEDATGR